MKIQVNNPHDKEFINLDITSPEHVQIQIKHDRKVIWVNVDGICRLRICQIKNLILAKD
jgi:hypothetical protein